jgi:salicylate 5-hydroxylase small subunit
MTFEDWFAITQFYARYSSIVDAGDWDRWPEQFTQDCVYRLQPRENHERNLPLATLAFTSRGMLMDRVYSIKDTLFPRPVLPAPHHRQPGRPPLVGGVLGM